MDPNAQQTPPAPAPAAAPAPSAAPEAEAPLAQGDSVKARAWRETMEALEGGEADEPGPDVSADEAAPVDELAEEQAASAEPEPVEAAPVVDAGPTDDEVAELERLAEKRRQDLAAAAQTRAAEARARTEQDAFAQQQREVQRLAALAKSDPLAFLRETGVDLVAAYDKLHETAKDPTAHARTAFERLEAQNRALLERLDRLEKGIPEREQAKEQADAQRRGEQVYAEHTGDAKAYPLQARLTAAERVAYGEQAAGLLRDAGKPYGVADVARLVERNLRAQVQRLTGASSEAGGQEAASAAVGETATPSGAQGQGNGRPPPRAISNQLAATSGGDGGYKSRHDLHAEVMADIARGAL